MVNNKFVQGAAKKKSSKDQTSAAATAVAGSNPRSTPASPSNPSNSASPVNSPIHSRQQLLQQLALSRDPSQQLLIKSPSAQGAAVKLSYRTSMKQPGALPYVSL